MADRLGTDTTDGDLEEDRAYEVIEPDRFMEMVPEVGESTVNTTVRVSGDTCSYDAPSQTDHYLTVYRDGRDPAGVIEQRFGVDDLSEVGEIHGGAALWRDDSRIETIAVEADGVVTLLRQSGVNVIPVDTWEGPLASYLIEPLAAVYP